MESSAGFHSTSLLFQQNQILYSCHFQGRFGVGFRAATFVSVHPHHVTLLYPSPIKKLGMTVLNWTLLWVFLPQHLTLEPLFTKWRNISTTLLEGYTSGNRRSRREGRDVHGDLSAEERIVSLFNIQATFGCKRKSEN